LKDEDSKIGVNDQKVIDATIPVNETKEEKDERSTVREYHDTKVGNKLSMAVKVYSPFKDYFDGQAFSLSYLSITALYRF
jgi:hypothetical protein